MSLHVEEQEETEGCFCFWAVKFLCATVSYMGEAQSEKVDKYRPAAEAGDAEAQYQLGMCFYHYGSTPADEASLKLWREDMRWARHWLRKALAQGHTGVAERLGYCHFNGLGVPKNPKKGITYFRQAARAGHAGAQFWLGMAYADFQEYPRRDVDKSIYWLNKAAVAGDSSAQGHLGHIFYFYKRDRETAFKWYELAAEQGDYYGLIHLALAYREGENVRKDLLKSYAFFLLSCRKTCHLSRRKSMIEIRRQLTPEQIRSAKHFARQFAAQFP